MNEKNINYKTNDTFGIHSVQRKIYIHSRTRKAIDRLYVAFDKLGWLCISIVSLLLGYMFIWKRGMFLDDYGIRNFTIDIITGDWQPITLLRAKPNFPARIVSWMITPSLAALLTHHEFIARIIITLIIGTNAFLLGWFVQRMLNSRFAGIISGWCFLMPVFTDVPLWASAVNYSFCVTCMLTCLHTYWNALVDHQHRLRWSATSIALFVVALSVKEQATSLVVIAFCLGIIALVKQQQKPYETNIRHVIALTSAMTIALIGYFLLVYHSTVMTVRQGLSADIVRIAEHTRFFLTQFVVWTVGADWGRAIVLDGFKKGLSETFASLWGIALIGVALALIIALVCLWREERTVAKTHSQYRIGFLVCLLGCIWLYSTLLFPYVLVSTQMYLERRFLYMPTAGLAIVIASVCWMINNSIRFRGLEKILLGINGILLLATSICMVGYAGAYRQRNALDRTQITALKQALPVQHLPSDTQIIPVQMEEPSLGNNGLFGILTGVLETSWSACGAIAEAYHRNDFQVIAANRWAPMQFSYTTEAKDSVAYLDCQNTRSHYHPDGMDHTLKLYAQGRYINRDKAVLFTYKKEHAFIIKDVIVSNNDGTQQLIRFPLAYALAAEGSPTIDNVVVQNQALEVGSSDGWE